MNCTEWIRSFTILQNYLDDKKYIVSAEHDQVFVEVEPDKISDEDWAELEKLDWFKDEFGGISHWV